MSASFAISTAAALYWRYHGGKGVFDLLATARYLFLFSSGAVMAMHAQLVCQTVAKLRRTVLTGLWLFGLGLITAPEVRLVGIPSSR
jgi:hypothetical protein